MPTMTPELWEQYYTRLRPYVLAEWPDIDEGRLGAIVGDFDALVELVAATDGASPETARDRLGSIDVDDADVEGPDSSRSGASLAQLRLGPGFAESEREMVETHLERLNRRLKRFPAEATELEITVSGRDDTTQEVVLEAWLPRFGHMAATSQERALVTALHDVRDSLWRQIDDAVNKRKDRR